LTRQKLKTRISDFRQEIHADTGDVVPGKPNTDSRIARIIDNCLRLNHNLDFLCPYLGKFDGIQLEAVLTVAVTSLRRKHSVYEALNTSMGAAPVLTSIHSAICQPGNITASAHSIDSHACG
jgi:hypothetical protein